MSSRRGREKRSFGQAIADQISEADEGRLAGDADTGYLRFGEYGRILRTYLRSFPKGAIKVVFSEEFKERRAQLLTEILAHIGAEAGHRVANLDRDYHVSGRRRFARLDGVLRGSVALKGLARQVLGTERYNRLWLWYETEWSMSRARERTLQPSEADQLRRYFANDVRILEGLLGRRVPWSEFSAEPALADAG